MADQFLNSLEQRVETLENRVFGGNDKDVHYPRDEPCIESLGNLNAKINSVTKGKDKYTKILNRLPEIEQYLDPVYTGRLTLTDDAKINILLAQEESIEQMAQNLEQLEKLKAILDSEHLKVLPSMTTKFQQLSQKHIQQQDDVAGMTEETKELLQSYHSLMLILSKQFLSWDETITTEEIKSLPKKSLD